ncbi:MerR family DNA-binding transcriptional regulator [Sutterella massiliensis]|uniref:MerR family DNA-binding transcriptional regulator n=1 Tax=Sutterella massiliensis TaxID=1816689 RepID=UPI0034DEAB39
MLCSIGIIAKHYVASPNTIRHWAQRGLIKVACRTFGGQRRFEVPTVSTALAGGFPSNSTTLPTSRSV